MKQVPRWAIFVFAGCMLTAFSPNLVAVYGIHNDYEMLVFKNHGLLFHEARHLFLIARPVAALLSNLTLLPVETVADYRWTRLFSVLSVCALGVYMMAICLRHLRTTAPQALVLALGTFLLPCFIYSVLNAPAWAAHLLPIGIAFVSYSILSGSNAQALGFLATDRPADLTVLAARAFAYARLRTVWTACLVLQLSFYDFPPNALIVAVFPVIMVLFSTTPMRYRMLIAMRDTGFLLASLAIYVVTVKGLYVPFVQLFYGDGRPLHDLSQFDQRMAASYDYGFNFNLGKIVERFGEVARIAGDTWFLPQSRFHWAMAAILAIAVLVAIARLMWRQKQPATSRGAFTFALCAVGIGVADYVIAVSPVLAASGGFVTYRTVCVPTALTAIFLIYAAQVIFGKITARVAFAVLLGTATASNFEFNYLTMRLARNETAYIRGVVQDALARQVNAVIVGDPRPFTLPEDHPEVTDEKGRAIPPFELGCFSGYCLQNTAVFVVLAREMGGEAGRKLEFYAERGGRLIPGFNCGLLMAPTITYPVDSDVGLKTIRYYRSLAPISCINYSLRWHDLSLDLGG